MVEKPSDPHKWNTTSDQPYTSWNKWKQPSHHHQKLRSSPRPYLLGTQLSASGHIGRTDFQPANDPVERSSRDGQSAGLASVATRLMKTRILSLNTKSQKILIKSQRSHLLEQPFTRAASTASESTKRRTSQPTSRSSKVEKAIIGPSISTGTICVFLSNHWAFTFWGTTAVNCIQDMPNDDRPSLHQSDPASSPRLWGLVKTHQWTPRHQRACNDSTR